MIEKLANNVGACRSSVDAAREELLEVAATDLTRMKTARCDDSDLICITPATDYCYSSERFNTLIALESDFASYARQLTHSLEGTVNANVRMCGTLKKMIQTHNSGAGGKLPKAAFASNVPRSISKLQA